MDCEKLQACPFYNDKMPMDKGLGAIYKKKYCKGNHLNCARFAVFEALGPEYVPVNLYPNMINVANNIINGTTPNTTV